MTREKILAMEPGPEMDAAVGRAIFPDRPLKLYEDEKHGRGRRWVYEDEREPVPPYSTSDAAALEVLKAATFATIREIEFRDDRTPDSLWRCLLNGPDRLYEEVEEPTLALAICRAALLAKL